MILRKHHIGILMLLWITSCHQTLRATENNSGVVKITHSHWLKNKALDMTFDTRIWYKDSFFIQEIKKIVFIDTFGVKSREIVLSHYLFHDLITEDFYEFSSFTDTATMLNSYKLNRKDDFPGAWNFMKLEKNKYATSPVRANSDTAINKVVYKRMIFNQNFGKGEFSTEIYLRCDRNHPFFKLFRYYSEMFKCDCVKIINYYPGTTTPSTTIELEFQRDSLVDQEINVFNTWTRRILDENR